MQRRTFAMGLALAAMTAGVRAQRAPATGDRLLQMQPMVSTTEGETHSSLAVSNGSFGAGDKDTRPLLAGRVGLYTEDALCQWDDVAAPVADSFDREPLQAFADGSQLANWRIAFLGDGSGGIVAGEPSPF